MAEKPAARRAGRAPGETEPAAGEGSSLQARFEEASARLEEMRRERDGYRRQVKRLRADLASRLAAGAAASPAPGLGQVAVDVAAYEDLRRAKRDLVRLLRRLGRPPLGWILHRQKGYRRLRQRWLREG